MFIDGKYNIITEYKPVFKGNNYTETDTTKIAEITDTSVSTKAITSYAQGLMNAQTNPISTETERKNILQALKTRFAQYKHPIYQKFEQKSFDELKKLNELLNIKITDYAGKEYPALWESSNIEWYLDNKCDLDSVLDCIKMTYKDKGVTKNIFDAHSVRRLLQNGVDIKSPDLISKNLQLL